MFARKALSVAAVIAASVPFVSAHGYMRYGDIDGVRFDAPVPNSGTRGSAWRSVNSVDPVTDLNSGAMACGPGSGNDASEVADARPGSVIKFNWSNGLGGPWPHNTGPLQTYMAPCGAGGCRDFNANEGEWFKIDQKTRHDGNGPWFQADLFENFDATDDVTIPTHLPAGEYLVRHEIIGMHRGGERGGAEIYAACLQIRLAEVQGANDNLVPGDKTVNLPAGSTSTFPGAYNPDEPGILANVYDPNAAYTPPGPSVVTDADLDGGDNNSGDDNTGDDDNTDDTVPEEASSSTSAEPSTSTQLPSCGQQSQKKAKRSQSAFRHIVDWKHRRSGEWKRTNVRRAASVVAPVDKREVVRPVVMSRIMRAIQ